MSSYDLLEPRKAWFFKTMKYLMFSSILYHSISYGIHISKKYLARLLIEFQIGNFQFFKMILDKISNFTPLHLWASLSYFLWYFISVIIQILYKIHYYLIILIITLIHQACAAIVTSVEQFGGKTEQNILNQLSNLVRTHQVSS